MDNNSSYCHASLKEKTKRSVIAAVTNSSGQVLTQPKQIEEEFVMFFTDLFGTECPPTQALDIASIQQGIILSSIERERIFAGHSPPRMSRMLFFLYQTIKLLDYKDSW